MSFGFLEGGHCIAHPVHEVAKRFLDFANWMVAWDRYALGAAMLGQMEFRQAMQYKAIIVEVCFAHDACKVQSDTLPW